MLVELKDWLWSREEENRTIGGIGRMVLVGEDERKGGGG